MRDILLFMGLMMILILAAGIASTIYTLFQQRHSHPRIQLLRLRAKIVEYFKTNADYAIIGSANHANNEANIEIIRLRNTASKHETQVRLLVRNAKFECRIHGADEDTLKRDLSKLLAGHQPPVAVSLATDPHN